MSGATGVMWCLGSLQVMPSMDQLLGRVYLRDRVYEWCMQVSSCLLRRSAAHLVISAHLPCTGDPEYSLSISNPMTTWTVSLTPSMRVQAQHPIAASEKQSLQHRF